MSIRLSRLHLALVLSVMVPLPAWPQGPPANKTLEINGHNGEAPVIDIQGRTYIDLESLVRIANGSLSFQKGQITLWLPASQSGQVPYSSSQSGPTQVDFSRDFIKSAIEEISLMREWASPLANAIQNGYPVTDTWVAPYRAKAESGLRIVSTSASNDADRNALQLLANDFQALQQWSTMLIDARKTMSAANYAISSDALHNHPLSQKIISCSRFLDSMLASGHFQDDVSCH